ncbi:MAG: 6-carboxytetrahydropterin synthase [Kordiimonadaceae bacterium]|nr:6-carboxytetrahydropterin synthase [Kordiimonadaceae bacterium]MBT6031547.1 6-carboxytetrahydropterin synthase [Kordiimonadaceae bacterium]
MFEICFTRRYSMSHRLFNLKNSKCFVPHGHNEYVKVYLSSFEGDDALDGNTNMSNGFKSLKSLWHNWIDNAVDHSMQLSNLDPLLNYFKENEPENLPLIMITPGDPTTEVLAALFYSKINAFLKAEDLNVRCTKVEIEETPTNTVIFHGDPNKAITVATYDGPERPWWQRPDMSINDL